jgi:choline-glycine betaine transporter
VYYSPGHTDITTCSTSSSSFSWPAAEIVVIQQQPPPDVKNQKPKTSHLLFCLYYFYPIHLWSVYGRHRRSYIYFLKWRRDFCV